ncbi:MAG: 7TM diverse intracellular signaling domain-containing protein [Bacteroidota bacterium]
MAIQKLVTSWTILVLLFFVTGVINANDTLIIRDDDNLPALEDYLLVPKTDSFRSVSYLQDHPEVFENANTDILNYGLTDKTRWVKLNIKNESEETRIFFLKIPYPLLNYINYYLYEDGKLVKEIQTGESRKFGSREIRTRNFTFKLVLEPGKNYEVYMSFNNDGDTLYIPIEILNTSELLEDDQKDHFYFSYVYGLFLFIFLLNFFLFVRLKKLLYLYYAIYVLWINFIFTTLDGYSLQYIWPNMPGLSNIMMNVQIGMAMIFLILFAQSFFELKKKERFSNMLFDILKVAFLFLVVLSLFDYPYLLYSFIFTAILTLLLYVLLSVVSLRLSYKGNPSGTVSFFAFFAWMICLFIYFGRDFGIFPSNFFTENGLKLSFAIEGIILNFAVINHFIRFHKEATTKLEIQNRKIHNHKNKLQVANEELKKLSVVARNSDNSVAVFDRNGVMEWSNNRFQNIHNLNGNNQELNIINIFKHPRIRHFIHICERKKQTVLFENRLKLPDGRIIFTQTTLTPLMNEQEQLEKLITIDSDITKIKDYEKEILKAKERAEESDKLKSAFLANMSHEIRTPMNAIVGFTKFLRSSTLPVEKKEKYLKIIDKSSIDLMRLIDDILDISKIEAGQVSIFNEDFILSDLINQLYESFTEEKKKLDKEHVKFELVYQNSTLKDVMIDSDPNRIKQVLSNLLNNSFKFTEKGKVELGVQIKNQNILFYVKDTGIGIEKDKLHLIFNRFHKIEDDKTKLYRGTGLGLAISERLVSLLGGNLWVESEPRKGSIFYFTIPFVKAKVNGKDTNLSNNRQNIYEENYSFKGKKILIAEDNPDNFELLREILEPTHAEINWAKNGEEAIYMAKEDEMDIVIMDVQMPLKNGYDTTKELRSFYNLPIVAVTAFAQPGEKEKCLASGCNEYISKPIDHAYFIEIINKYLFST